RTPIVIPVINEIGLRGPVGDQPGGRRHHQDKNSGQSAKPMTMGNMPRRKFPTKQVPDTEANDTRGREKRDTPSY
ncbi:hypothetical protein B7Z17_04395, partial [Candidatus Saccharibacteria bacterium 32-49-10]